MKAVRYIQAGQPPEIVDVPQPTPGPGQVLLRVAGAGVCHSDLHVLDHGGFAHPFTLGHENAGHIAALGQGVVGYKEGDAVAVYGPWGCGHCHACQRSAENYCQHHASLPAMGGGLGADGGMAEYMIVPSPRLLVPLGTLDPVQAAPLSDAALTPYHAIKAALPWLTPDASVVVVGIGGLGHMGVKLAHAMGAHVVAFTTSDGKRQAALDLGANEVVVSRNAGEMKAHAGSFDFILNTVAASHSLDAYTSLLKRDGTMVLVGVPEHPHPTPNIGNLIFKRRAIAGSLIGGIAETQEMLDFCADKGIVSDIEMIRAQQIDEAYDRMVKGDVKYRFVIDNSSLAS